MHVEVKNKSDGGSTPNRFDEMRVVAAAIALTQVRRPVRIRITAAVTPRREYTHTGTAVAKRFL